MKREAAKPRKTLNTHWFAANFTSHLKAFFGFIRSFSFSAKRTFFNLQKSAFHCRRFFPFFFFVLQFWISCIFVYFASLQLAFFFCSFKCLDDEMMPNTANDEKRFLRDETRATANEEQKKKNYEKNCQRNTTEWATIEKFKSKVYLINLFRV